MGLHGQSPFQAANQYVVKEQIAAGGMGTVYRAFDVQLKRHVALKVLKSLDYDSLERFVREREITADLDHPNFVRILTTGYIATPGGRRPFYTMPLLRGETLASLIRNRCAPGEEGERLREEFTLARLLQLIQQLCLALESAHHLGIIHRDLKPANVILGPYGEIYIVDLGLAKYVRVPEHPGTAGPGGEEAGSGEDLTAQAPAGTPFFMAPEQLLDPLRVDARTDIFGLGAILYYILTSQRPMYRPTTAPGPVIRNPGAMPTRPQADRTSRPDVFLGTAKFPQWHEETDGSVPSSATEILYRTLHGVLIPPDELAAQHRQAIEAGQGEGPILDHVDPALNAICLKALARAPEDRYPSARAMWQELQQYLEGRLELIFKREATDLTRNMTRRTLPTALRDYDLAEGRLRERIAQKESVGRVGIEETLDLFDLMLEKAKVFERRGESGSIIRSVTRAEPLIETALEVLQRQFIQLLIVKGTAQADQKDFAGAKANLAKAIALSRMHRLDDLMASAYCGYGRSGGSRGGAIGARGLDHARGPGRGRRAGHSKPGEPRPLPHGIQEGLERGQAAPRGRAQDRGGGPRASLRGPPGPRRLPPRPEGGFLGRRERRERDQAGGGGGRAEPGPRGALPPGPGVPRPRRRSTAGGTFPAGAEGPGPPPDGHGGGDRGVLLEPPARSGRGRPEGRRRVDPARREPGQMRPGPGKSRNANPAISNMD